MDSQNFVVYPSIAGASFLIGKAFNLFNRTTKHALESLEETIERLEEEVHELSDLQRITRHELRDLRMKYEAEMTRNRILTRYLKEAKIEIRDEDRELLILAALPPDKDKT